MAEESLIESIIETLISLPVWFLLKLKFLCVIEEKKALGGNTLSRDLPPSNIRYFCQADLDRQPILGKVRFGGSYCKAGDILKKKSRLL